MKDNRNIYREKLKEYQINSINQSNNNENNYTENYIQESIIEKVKNFMSFNRKKIYILIIVIIILVLIILLLLHNNKTQNKEWDKLINYINTEYNGEFEKKVNSLFVTISVIDNKKIHIDSNDIYFNTENYFTLVNSLSFDLIKNESVCELNGSIASTSKNNIDKLISTELDISKYMRGDEIYWQYISIPSGLSRYQNNKLDLYIEYMFNAQFGNIVEILEGVLLDSKLDITMSDIGFHLY